MGQRIEILMGGPGTGKTHQMKLEIQRLMRDGLPSERIALLSFTRAAAKQAAQRLGLPASRTPFFSTVHAMCFKEIGLTPRNVMSAKHYKSLGIQTRDDGDAEEFERTRDENLLSAAEYLSQVARNRCVPIARVHQEVLAPYPLRSIEAAAEEIRRFKQTHGLYDFTDMLEELHSRKGFALPVKQMFIDEAQDLTPLQFSVIFRAGRAADRIVFAGDDDQTLYPWAGVDVRVLHGIRATHRTVISQSYRVPAASHALAVSALGHIRKRIHKKWEPRPARGDVEGIVDLEPFDLHRGTWLMLARTRYATREYKKMLVRKGLPFRVGRGTSIHREEAEAITDLKRLAEGQYLPTYKAKCVADMAGIDLPKGRKEWDFFHVLPHRLEREPWHEILLEIPAERRIYYQVLQEKGYDLMEEPKIRVSTIHGAKGLEADNVALDLALTRRIAVEQERDPDAEQRVLFVGLTRAKNKLYLLNQCAQFTARMERPC